MSDPRVRVWVERAGRAGKTVTRVGGLPGHPEGKTQLLKTLQKLCGAGGTYKEGVLELQGDHRPRVAAHLESLGHRISVS